MNIADDSMSPRSLAKRWRDVHRGLRRRIAATLIGDRTYVSRLYRDAFGRAPDLDHPVGFNEKILVKMLTDRRPFLTALADKLRVRAYVARATAAVDLPELYWWSDRADALALDALPDAFVLKPNHGSGWLRIVDDRRSVRRADLVRLARSWLASDFTVVGREWAYRNVRRAVYAEERLRGADGQSPPDYKLFVFGGRVKVIQVDRDRFARHTQVLYDRDWNRIEGTIKARQGSPMRAPRSLSTMIEAAETLSLGVDFVRVDFYDIAGRACFGEFTHYPNKGLCRFQPESLDQVLGGFLRLDDYGRDGISQVVGVDLERFEQAPRTM